MKQFIAQELADFAFIARNILDDFSSSKVILFKGEMGVGKTTFIQYVLKAMGIEELEGSPTYPIVLMYESAYFGTIAHIDVYRLESVEEAVQVGLEELYYNGTVCLVEWGERFLELLPKEYLQVELHENELGHRIVTWERIFLD